MAGVAVLAFASLAAHAAPQQNSGPNGPAAPRHRGAWAHRSQAGPGPGWRMGGFLARALNLTDDQKNQVKTILQNTRPAVQPLLQQLAANRQAMQQAIESPTPDKTAIQNLANAQGQLVSQLAVIRANTFSQIYSTVLTPDQQAKLKELQSKRQNRGGAGSGTSGGSGR